MYYVKLTIEEPWNNNNNNNNNHNKNKNKNNQDDDNNDDVKGGNNMVKKVNGSTFITISYGLSNAIANY